MPPATHKSTVKQPELRKSILVIPSCAVSNPTEQEGGEEIEIAAQISVPEEGGWGWVVVLGSFWCLFILDGVAFTFGSLLTDMTKELKVDDSYVALINSVGIALYFIAGPLASAYINRFGFRVCAMSGSVIASLSLFFSYFSTNYASLLVFYGLCAGFGYCLINMAAGLIVGFYFEKLRSLAIALTTTGSSAGVMVFFPLNSYLVSLSGWRTTILLHSGLTGIVFFLGMTFRPLLSLTVIQTSDDPTRTVTYLPSLSKAAVQTTSEAKGEGLKSTVTERLFSAVSNANFPTAAAVVKEDIVATASQPGPSTRVATSRLTLTANTAQGSISRRQLKQVQSIISRNQSVHDKSKNIQLTIQVEEQQSIKKPKCCPQLCHWEDHVSQARPLYRDDAFYEGNIENLPIYQKSMIDTRAEAKTGLEYQMAVSRAVTAGDLQERRGVFTTAVRRVLATMMDPKLLKRPSFLMFCTSGLLSYIGFLVPYVFIKDRNLAAGIDVRHCTWFVTAIGFANAMGRLCIGGIGVKISPLRLYSFSCCIGGISSILSDLSYNIYYQYAYCALYGFFVGSFASLRSMVIVSLYGLDKLTNATGMLLLFLGIGSLISTPLAGVLKNMFGYQVSFCVSGIFMVVSSIILLPVRMYADKEVRKETTIKEKIAKK